MFYINTYKKKFVNSVNMITGKKLSVDFAVTDQYSFALLDREGKKQDIDPSNSFYIAGDINFNLSDDLCFYSTNYTVDQNTITFEIDTYTEPYLNKITEPNTELNIEIRI